MNIIDAIYQQGFFIVDDFLIEQDYLALQTLIKKLQTNGQFTPAHVGHRQHKKHHATLRNDQISWIDPQQHNPELLSYVTKIDNLCTMLNQALYLGLVNYEMHFAIYQANNFYKKHIDQFANNQDRRISCVYYLNENWQSDDGGELRLYDRQDQPLITLMPRGNRFVCFESDLPHEVCTAYQTRYSIATWLKVRSLT